jgi:hypothetical protein
VSGPKSVVLMLAVGTLWVAVILEYPGDRHMRGGTGVDDPHTSFATDCGNALDFSLLMFELIQTAAQM